MKQHPEVTWDIATDFGPDNPHDSTHARLTLSYTTGGTNAFSGQREMRGFQLAIFPVQITDTGFNTLIGDRRGARFFLEVAPKWNAAQLAALESRLHPHMPDLAQRLAAGDKAGIRKRLDDVVAGLTGGLTAI